MKINTLTKKNSLNIRKKVNNHENAEWIFKQMSPAEENLVKIIELKGDIYITALENALSELVENHDFFDFSKCNCKNRDNLFSFNFSDFSESNQQQRDIGKIYLQEKNFDFDVKKDNLIRCNLIKLEKNRHLFLINIHELVNDGISDILFTKEVMFLYRDQLQHTNSMNHSILAASFFATKNNPYFE